MPSRKANPYYIKPNQRGTVRAFCRERNALVSLQGKTVQLRDTSQGELTDEQYEIIQRANFIGKVTRIDLPTEKLRVKFGNGQQLRDTCHLWVERSQVDLIE